MKMEQKDYSMIKKGFSENINLIKSHYDYLQKLEKSEKEISRTSKIDYLGTLTMVLYHKNLEM